MYYIIYFIITDRCIKDTTEDRVYNKLKKLENVVSHVL